MSHNKITHSVKVLIAGGNISLISVPEKRGFKHATEAEVCEYALGSKTTKTITINEGNATDREVYVDVNSIASYLGLDIDEDNKIDAEEADSAQVNPEIWQKLAQYISEQHKKEKYAGFVILHGLDTLAYTSSALSFLLKGVNVPIILTGSQRPLDFGRTDASQNIVTAITIIGSMAYNIIPVINDVMVLSHDMLFKGNRVHMASAFSYRSFESANYPPFAVLGEYIDVNTNLIIKNGGSQFTNTNNKLDAVVRIIDVFPGISSSVFDSILEENQRAEAAGNQNAKVRGIILRTYGMGTAPTNDDVLQSIRRLIESNIVIMNVSQARCGRISNGKDPVSLRLFEQGVVSGSDMTCEAAYSKMVIMLSSKKRKTPYTGDDLQKCYCGEQNQSIINILYEQDGDVEFDDNSGDAFCLLKSHDIIESHKIDQNEIKYAQLRILGLQPADRPDTRKRAWETSLEIFLIPDETIDDRPNEDTALKKDNLKWTKKGRKSLNVAYDIQKSQYPKILDNRNALSMYSSFPLTWKSVSIIIYVNKWH